MNLDDQVAKFREKRAAYKEYAGVLEKVLELACVQVGVVGWVSARAKTVESFAQKALRKSDKYDEPVRQLTDLAGARVITYTQADADRVSRFIEEHFVVDTANSLDVRSRLKTEEFGYRALHYVVQVRARQLLGVKIPPEIRGRKAEIQICTMLQHVWATIGHDRLYKTPLKVPEILRREIAQVAAQLENADQHFARTIAALDSYRASFDAYMTPEDMEQELKKLDAVRRHDDQDRDVALRMARLARALGQHARALEVLARFLVARGEGEEHDPFGKCDDPEVLREAGLAACGAGEKAKGCALVTRAVACAAGDEHRRLRPAALCDLGDCIVAEDKTGALNFYEPAFREDPTDPRILEAYLDCKLRCDGHAGILGPVRGSLEAAIAECHRRAELGVDLPAAHYMAAKFQLFLGRPWESLHTYARASHLSRAAQRVDEACVGIRRLIKDVGVAEIGGIDWVRGFLELAVPCKLKLLHRDATARVRDAERRREQAQEKQAEKERDPAATGQARDEAGEALQSARAEVDEASEQEQRLAKEATAAVAALQTTGLGTQDGKELSPPIIIVAGGCDQSVDAALKKTYGPLIEQAFAGLSGTVICGGTTSGVSGIVGDLPELDREHKIGYVPDPLPKGDSIHSGYGIRTVPGEGYTPLGPIQTWADLVAQGADPWNIRLLGINGGRLTAFEYRLALALGGTVGVIESSGRAALDILPDAERWDEHGSLLRLPEDPMTIRAFVQPPPPHSELGDKHDEAAQAIHERYVHLNRGNPRRMDPSMLPWPQLREDFRESNREQAAYAASILRAVGYGIERGDPGDPPYRPDDYEEKIKEMAEMEHGRWNVERLRAGWRYGPQSDAVSRIHSCLVAWDKLPEKIREYDYDAARRFPDILARAGLRIVKPESK